jgi:hypothetical protein
MVVYWTTMALTGNGGSGPEGETGLLTTRVLWMGFKY